MVSVTSRVTGFPRRWCVSVVVIASRVSRVSRAPSQCLSRAARVHRLARAPLRYAKVGAPPDVCSIDRPHKSQL